MRKSRVSAPKKIQHRFSGRPQSFEQARLVPGGDKGFTIKELLMALVVIGVLFGLAVPQYYALKSTREKIRLEKLENSEIKKPHKKSFKNLLPFLKKKSQ